MMMMMKMQFVKYYKYCFCDTVLGIFYCSSEIVLRYVIVFEHRMYCVGRVFLSQHVVSVVVPKKALVCMCFFSAGIGANRGDLEN